MKLHGTMPIPVARKHGMRQFRREYLSVARVMITCPETGRPVYTHLDVDWETFESTRIGERMIECSECHKVHTWRRCDVDLDEDGMGG